MSGQHRVVVTGVGLTSPIGNTLPEAMTALQRGDHGIVARPEWEAIGNLNARLAAEVTGLDLTGYSRKKTRTMGRVALLATYATEAAIEDAGLNLDNLPKRRIGLTYGSTHGSAQALVDFCGKLLQARDLGGVAASGYLKFMSHTCAANLAQYFGIRGRVVSTCAACVSAGQAVGAAYELIKHGQQDVVLCGGAEEMHYTHVAVFDLLYATSTNNSRPDRSSRPFDTDRDGLVVGEGAGTLVLESLEHANARGATIHGEIIGYGTNCDGTHLTQPSAEGMADAMKLALEDAAIEPGAVQYINAHATATVMGDIAESHATAEAFGGRTPISSTKGHTGHTLGACGAIEVAFGIGMMREGFVAHTRNLDNVDPRCASLEYVRDEPRPMKLDTFMSNNFAFGGINTSLIVRRV